jgi:hypothetical protein
MRVIVLNDYGHVAGGAAQVAISSLNALAGNGVDVIFVSSVGPVDPTIRRDIVEVVNFGLDDLLENSSRIQAAVMGIWDWRCAARFRAVLARLLFSLPKRRVVQLPTTEAMFVEADVF